MYIDGKGFQYKQNPLGYTRAPKTKEWRQKGESLSYWCIAKRGGKDGRKKEGSRNSNFMVRISFNKGFVLYEQYFGSIITIKFAKIVRTRCPNALK